MSAFSGQDRNSWTFQSRLTGEVTALGFDERGEGLAGDANGVVRVWHITNGTLRHPFGSGTGPVQGLAWMALFTWHYIVAVPWEGGGSRLQVWRDSLLNETEAAPAFVGEQDHTAPITMLAPVPGPAGNLTVGHGDGTLSILHVNASIVHVREDPERPPPDGSDDDGPGPWRTWGLPGVLLLAIAALAAARVLRARLSG